MKLRCTAKIASPERGFFALRSILSTVEVRDLIDKEGEREKARWQVV